MPRPRFAVRLCALIIALCLFVPLFSGCAQQKTSPADAFLKLWLLADYDAMYDKLTQTAQGRITREDFIAKYTNIYDGIGMTGLKLELLSSEGDDDVHQTRVRATYTCTDWGDISQDIVLTLFFHPKKAIWQVEWTPGAIFEGMEWGDTARVVTRTAPRGDILLSDGTILATDGDALAVMLEMSYAEDTVSAAAAIADALGLDAESLQKRLDKAKENGTHTLRIGTYPPDSLSQETLDALNAIDGVFADDEGAAPVRNYPQGTLLAHTVGYMSLITEEYLAAHPDEGYAVDSLVGSAGLERAYESTLRGTDGKEIVIYTALGARRKSVALIAPKPGLDLTLTIDPKLQRLAEEGIAMLDTSDGAVGSAVVAINVETGAVLASASGPSLDANLFSYPMPNARWEALNDPKENYPLVNRVTQSTLPPGSVFKSFTAATAIEHGYGLYTTFPYADKISERSWKPSGWIYPPIVRWQDYEGEMNMVTGLIHSDNIYYGWLAMRLGPDVMRDLSETLALSEPFTYDLPVAKGQLEGKGDIASHEKLLADSGYGQGEVLVTPLQLASLFGVFANGGIQVQPYLVAETSLCENGISTPVDTFESTGSRRVFEATTVGSLQDALRRVVTEGTGTGLNVSGHSFCAKTGTAQIITDAEDDDVVTRTRNIGWLCTYDRNDPEIVYLVMVDGTSEQADQKSKLIRHLLELD